MDIYGASPKAISGRTSYLRVRLEFLRYPHLMPTLFNGCGCGPPPPLTVASAWTWIGHPVSGLRLLTCAQLKLGFPAAPGLKPLALPAHAARRTVLQKVRGHTSNSASTACRHSVSGSLSLPSRGAFHLSLTVLFSIGHWVVFSLTGWSPLIPTRFLVSRGTLDTVSLRFVSHTGLSPISPVFPVPFCYKPPSILQSEPQMQAPGLGSSAFARRYLRNHMLFSLPPAT